MSTNHVMPQATGGFNPVEDCVQSAPNMLVLACTMPQKYILKFDFQINSSFKISVGLVAFLAINFKVRNTP